MKAAAAVALAGLTAQLSSALRLQQQDEIVKTDLSRALDCLKKTTPSVRLEYPEDAEQHMEEIREAFRPFFRGFVYSYHVEDMWMAEFLRQWENRPNGTRLHDLFGPYIPIFTVWVDPWFKNGRRTFGYPTAFMQAFKKVIRKNVPYIAVSQNDEGIAGKQEINLTEYSNILVLSAGGHGHVPVPLIKTHRQTLKEVLKSYDEDLKLQSKRKPPGLRRYFVSYVGSIEHAPHRMRERMKDAVDRFAVSRNLTDQVLFYRAPREDRSWGDVMLSSRFSLVPRGYGRTAYHLVETIQRGLIPILVYTDIPWLPYGDKLSHIAFSSTVENLPSLLDQLHGMSDDELSAREAAMATLARSHFSRAGVAEQIQNFMTGSSDLTCQQLPANITGA
mmetsp:Transcript_124858/g.364665  ORF Transcript_124858/g.364665 Transcript_124858/m.364665 type:complete len:389 (+) Transcript_124858:87-1253(+)